MDVLATVLEEMPPFPEKESSGLLNLLKKKRPGRVPENPEIKSGGGGGDDGESNGKTNGKNALDMGSSAAAASSGGGAGADLLGLGIDGGGGVNGNGTADNVTDNLKK